MSKPLIQILVLAVTSDGEHHPEEKTLLESYKTYYPTIRSMSQQEIDTEVQAFWTKRDAGMEDADIIDGLGKQLSEDEKNTAYALAVEVCASNYEIAPSETTFIKCIEGHWKIKKKIIDAVKLSCQMRYSVS